MGRTQSADQAVQIRSMKKHCRNKPKNPRDSHHARGHLATNGEFNEVAEAPHQDETLSPQDEEPLCQ